MNAPITYVSYSTLEKLEKRVGVAVGRIRGSVDAFDASSRARVSIRADDLRYLLAQVETLKADIVEAQRAALEEAAETIEFIAPRIGVLTWQSCVVMIRPGMPESTLPSDQPPPVKRIKRRGKSADDA